MKAVSTFVFRSALLFLGLGLAACGKMQSAKLTESPINQLSQTSIGVIENETPSNSQPQQQTQQQTQTQTQQQSQPPTPPQSTPPDDSNMIPEVAANFDLFHPVVINFVMSGTISSKCSEEASAYAGSPVKCKIGGGCDGKNPTHMGACFLSPVRKDLRNNSSIIASMYENSDRNFPQGLKTAKYLKHLYLTVLKREPDVAGFYYWLNEHFNNNATLPALPVTHLTDAIITSTENKVFWDAFKKTDSTVDAFLTQLYSALLNRAPDAEGKSYWMQDMIVNNQSPNAVLNNFYLSTDFKSSTQGL